MSDLSQSSVPEVQGRSVEQLETDLGIVLELNLTAEEFDRLNQLREIAGVDSNESFIKFLVAEYRARVMVW